ncbi:hypothetical protein [Bacteroidaceae bacterium]|jgi:hypothetical protein
MTTLKKLCNYLMIALCILSLLSCSNDDEGDYSGFTLQSIEWKLSADDTIKDGAIELPTTIDTNDNNESMYLTFSIEEHIVETSQFYCDDPELFNKLTQRGSILVSITRDSNGFSSEFKRFWSDLQVPFSLVETILPPSSKTEDTIEVPPHTRLTTMSKIHTKECTATYLATFAKENGEIIKITGKWKGFFNYGSEVYYKLENIK